MREEHERDKNEESCDTCARRIKTRETHFDERGLMRERRGRSDRLTLMGESALTVMRPRLLARTTGENELL